MSSFGDTNQTKDLGTQKASLLALAKLAMKATVHPLVRGTALKIVQGCASRADACELQAVFRAVKNGDPNVAPFKGGFKYVADPRYSDYFAHPADSIKMCLKGACGGDCDDHAGMIAALLGALGWKTGLRAWGPDSASGEFVHVYAVVAFPKRPPFTAVYGLDTTVDESKVGWEPPRSNNVLTAWLP